MRKINVENFELLLDETVYEPREDSKLIIENMEVKKGEDVLDIGTGSGILSLIASDKAKTVLGVDLNGKAVKIARKNAKLNGMENIKFKVSDLFQNIDNKFDVILFNPPYLPTEGENKIWSGGKNGRELIEEFSTKFGDYLKGKGRIYIVFSSLTDEAKIKKLFESKGFKVKRIAKRKVPWESLIVFEIKRN